MAIFRETQASDALTRYLEMARNHGPMTAAEIRDQRIGFAYGQMMDCAPGITKEDVARVHDGLYGPVKGT